jgi:hypothetical protein
MASRHHFTLQHFDKWWHDADLTLANLDSIPSYHIGDLISENKTYELHCNDELVVLIPTHYRNGIRFLNHVIVCYQELLHLLGPSYHWNHLQSKYETFQRELSVLIKIRAEFIQEALSKYPSHQSRLQSTQWTSSILDSFLAYLYYCGSVNPHHKSHMMSILLDDPQTYSKSG